MGSLRQDCRNDRARENETARADPGRLGDISLWVAYAYQKLPVYLLSFTVLVGPQFFTLNV